MLKGRLTDVVLGKPGIGLIGKIKIGGKQLKQGKNPNDPRSYYPVSFDYFVPQAPKQYVDLFHKAFGDQPNKIEIIFISDDIRHSCNVQYELRGDDGNMFARGDGENFEIYNADKWVPMTKAELEIKYGSIESFKKESERFCGSFNGWQVRLTMRFMIPKIQGVIAEWQLSTGGVNSSIGQITQAFDLVLAKAGTVINVPFDLSVEKVTSDAFKSKKKYPVLKLIPNVSVENLTAIHEALADGVELWRQGLLTDDRILELKSGN